MLLKSGGEIQSKLLIETLIKNMLQFGTSLDGY